MWCVRSKEPPVIDEWAAIGEFSGLYRTHGDEVIAAFDEVSNGACHPTGRFGDPRQAVVDIPMCAVELIGALLCERHRGVRLV